jgi:pectin methylesterase-like acyl-CoA thioesterase
MAGVILALSAGLVAPAEATPPEARAVVVAGDGSGDFRTVQEAVDAVPAGNAERFVIRIRPGTYKGRVVVPPDKPFVSFLGEDAERTILTNGVNARMLRPDGTEVGTADSASTVVHGKDFSAEGLTFENSSGPGAQALAISIYGDRAVFRRCRFLGWQDTVLADGGRQYFRDCDIAGHVDFIFGRSTAFFEGCRLHCRAGGFITAASTPPEQPFGFVFSRCRITGDPDPQGYKVYLGRPWRPHASVTFLETEMGDVIEPAGWHNWGKPENEATARFAEYRSRGPGASPGSRVSWARQLTDEQAAAITAAAVLRGADGWDPQATATSQPSAGRAPGTP